MHSVKGVKRMPVYFNLIYLTVLTAVFLGVWPCQAKADSESALFEKLRIFSIAVHEVRTKFVEIPDSESMINGAINGMLSTLDPHSSYMTTEEMREFQQEASGSFFGVGIEIFMQDKVLTIVSPIEGTPGYKAGLQSNDKIIKIDGKATQDMTLTEAVKMIRGARGTKVTFTIYREKTKITKDISVVRDLIPLRSARSEILEPGYPLLRVSSFQGDTAESTLKFLKEYTADPGLKGIIIDLRNNPGGLLDQSIKMTGYFMGKVLVVQTKGRLPENNVEYTSDSAVVVPDNIPIVVLVNEGSASASEIVAGALQDYGRATIVGNQSFGKGSVQTILPLPDGSGLRLTTARFYTPSGRSIQTEGIKPDVDIDLADLPESYTPIREIDLDRHLTGENENKSGAKKKDDKKSSSPKDADKLEQEDPEKPRKMLSEMTLEERLKIDTQLAKALEMLKAGQVKPKPKKFGK